jgi:hypothetical protein
VRTRGQRTAATIGFLALLCFLAGALTLKIFPKSKASLFLLGPPNRLLYRDSGEWRRVELPGSPYEILAGSGSDIWVVTYRPDGLSRWSQGQWTHFDIPHNPSGAFAVSGKQAWVIYDNGIRRFDDGVWRRLPTTVRDSMATAAEGNDVWVISVSGMLTHCASDDCETHSVTNQIPDPAWQSRILARVRNVGSKTLVRAFGRLWFIHDVVWYSTDGREWKRWIGHDNARVWPLGYSGGRIWLKTWDSLLAIGEDLQATEFPLDPLSMQSVYDVHAGDGRVMLAAGRQGLLERTTGGWNSVSMDAALRAGNVWKVASTPDGGIWMVVTNPLGLTWRVLPTASVIGILFAMMMLVLRRRAKLLSRAALAGTEVLLDSEPVRQLATPKMSDR